MIISIVLQIFLTAGCLLLASPDTLSALLPSSLHQRLISVDCRPLDFLLVSVSGKPGRRLDGQSMRSGHLFPQLEFLSPEFLQPLLLLVPSNRDR